MEHSVQSDRAKVYWSRVRSLYSPEFLAEMDGLLGDRACL
jgi:hypothetical protein